MITEDEKLLTWVSKKYPNFSEVIMEKASGTWHNYKYVRMPLIMSLATLTRFHIEWVSDTPSKKTYNNTIKKLRNHIIDNPDVILFALL